MIVREREADFVMIEQHHHAQLSAKVISKWQELFFTNDDKYPSVLYAIANHDIGWQPFDEQPFWNDKSNAPYSFTDFPSLAKAVLYEQGIDKVEETDPYAALLCSLHYSRFMADHPHESVKKFVLQEQARRVRLITEIPEIDKTQFAIHFEWLRFADNVSLYLCLNEPGVQKENEHIYFRKGISLSSEVTKANTDVIPCYWVNDRTVVFQKLPPVDDFAVQLNQKIVSKQLIATEGLQTAYGKTPYTEKQIEIRIEDTVF